MLRQLFRKAAMMEKIRRERQRKQRMLLRISGLAPEESGAASGTFGLFRDLSAPFGVAVLVPLFTRQVTAAQALGLPVPQAAAQALHTLAWVELGCIAGAALTLWLIPRET